MQLAANLITLLKAAMMIRQTKVKTVVKNFKITIYLYFIRRII